MKRSA